jgi:DHA1 family multidrug resistance protein-like MFS transporter
MERWKTNLYTVWFSQIIMLMCFSFGVPFLSYYIQDLGIVDVNRIKVYSSILSMVPALSMAIMAPIWGIVADKWGKKLMLLRAMLFAAFIIGAMGFATSANQLVVLRLLQGVFTGTVTAATALVATGTPTDKLSYSIGFLSSATFIGSSIGPVIGGLLAGAFGYRVSFWLAGALSLVDFFIVFYFVKEEKPVLAAGDTVSLQARPNKDESKIKSGNLAFFLSSVILTILFIIFILRFVRSVFSPYLPLYVQEQIISKQSASTITGIINGVIGLMSALAGLTLSRLGDRYDKFMVLKGMFLVGIVLSVPLVFTHGLLSFTILYGLFFFVLGGVEPIAVSMSSELTPPDRRGFLFGVQGLVGNMAWVVSPVLGGLISIRLSNHAVLFLIPVFLIPGFASVIYFEHVRGRKRNSI